MTSKRITIVLLLFSAVVASCFNPPIAQEPPESKTTAVVPLPFDLTWTAVTDVIKLNDYRIQAQDPNHGILEVLGHRFTLQDADCGKIESIVGNYPAEPESNATAVYNFHVTPV